jgi:hypothetical protein
LARRRVSQIAGVSPPVTVQMPKWSGTGRSCEPTFPGVVSVQDNTAISRRVGRWWRWDGRGGDVRSASWLRRRGTRHADHPRGPQSQSWVRLLPAAVGRSDRCVVHRHRIRRLAAVLRLGATGW